MVAFLRRRKHKSNETALQKGIVPTLMLLDFQRERQFVLLNRGGSGCFSFLFTSRGVIVHHGLDANKALNIHTS